MTSQNVLRIAAAVAVSVGLVVSGCSSDDSSNPKPSNSGGTAGTAGTGGSGATGGGGTGGGSGGMAGSGGSGATGGGNTGGMAGSDAGNCTPDGSACYSCPPTNTGQFLNACTTATCSHFDNSKLTKLAADGGLPPLP